MLLIEKHSSAYQRKPPYDTISFAFLKKTLFPENLTYAFSSSAQYRLVFFLEGKATFSSKNGSFCTKKYDCAFLRRNESFQAKFEEQTEIIIAAFQYQGELPFFQNALKIFEDAVDLKDLFLRLCDAQRFSSTVDGTNEATILLILNELHTRTLQSNEKISLYRKCCLWAEENAYKNASVKDLANDLGYTAEHLNRIVRRFCNASLAELLAEKRIEKIRFLANEGGYSVKELANIFDFYSAELLRKYYRYHTGKNLTEEIKSL